MKQSRGTRVCESQAQRASAGRLRPQSGGGGGGGGKPPARRARPGLLRPPRRTFAVSVRARRLAERFGVSSSGRCGTAPLRRRPASEFCSGERSLTELDPLGFKKQTKTWLCLSVLWPGAAEARNTGSLIPGGPRTPHKVFIRNCAFPLAV